MSKPSIDLGEWTPDPSKVIEPSVGKKAEGFNPDEKPPAQYFNWYWKGLLEWAKWLFTVSIDTATSITSFNINKGVNVTNNGINTTTVNCSSLSIDSASSNGKVSDSNAIDIVNTSAFDIKNSLNVSLNADATTNLTLKNSSSLTVGEVGSNASNINVSDSNSGTIIGDDLRVENSSGFTIKGSNNSIKNCTDVTIGSAISNSSMENITEGFIETRNDTKTLKDLRILGSNIVKKVVSDKAISSIGLASQISFGLGGRYITEKDLAIRYYFEDSVLGWRTAVNDGTRLVTGGAQVFGGLFANALGIIGGGADSASCSIDLNSVIDTNASHTVNFWIRAETTETTDELAVAALHANLWGWEIFCTSSTSGSLFYFQDKSGLNDVLFLPELKFGEYMMITVVYNLSKWDVYINGKFVGFRNVISKDTGTDELVVNFGDAQSYAAVVSARVDVADLSYTYGYKSNKEVIKLYCGGIELDSADSSFFINRETKSIVKDTNGIQKESPDIIDIDDYKFIFLNFPAYTKYNNGNTIDMFSEKYILEAF